MVSRNLAGRALLPGPPLSSLLSGFSFYVASAKETPELPEVQPGRFHRPASENRSFVRGSAALAAEVELAFAPPVLASADSPRDWPRPIEPVSTLRLRLAVLYPPSPYSGSRPTVHGLSPA